MLGGFGAVGAVGASGEFSTSGAAAGGSGKADGAGAEDEEGPEAFAAFAAFETFLRLLSGSSDMFSAKYELAQVGCVDAPPLPVSESSLSSQFDFLVAIQLEEGKLL